MTIHSYSHYYLPILKSLSSHKELHRLEVASEVAKLEGLTEAETSLTNARGTVLFQSRVHWAIQYLVMSGALIRPSRGRVAITDRGRQLLSDYPQGFGDEILERFEELQAWFKKSKTQQVSQNKEFSSSTDSTVESESPEEQIATALDQVEAAIAADLVNRILQQPPVFLEQLVLKLLHAMGYGDSEDDLTHTGASGDEGVDGFIKQDKLGIQNLYVQAKRYAPGNTIGRPAIQGFVGAIAEKANSGVFITTSTFSKEAVEYANSQKATRVILIDGHKLGKLLVEYEIGVKVKRTHKYLEIDEEFFGE